jgi:type IV pilus assembly protein PilW
VQDAARGWSIFYVATGTDGVAELRCKYRGATAWKAEGVVRGVDSMQVLYGLDTDTPADGRPNSYETASAIDARDAALSLSGADDEARARDLNRKTHWKRVCAVRVSLLLHGAKYAGRHAVRQPFQLSGDASGACSPPPSCCVTGPHEVNHGAPPAARCCTRRHTVPDGGGARHRHRCRTRRTVRRKAGAFRT